MNDSLRAIRGCALGVGIGALMWLAIIGAGCAMLGCTGRIHGPPSPQPVGGSDLSALLVWVIAASIVGIGLSIAALMWLPTKAMALSGAAGFAAMLIVALTVKVAQPYMGWVVLGGFVLCACAGLIAFRKWVMTGRAAMSLGCDALAAAAPEAAEQIKINHSAVQKRLGVHGIVTHELSKLKTGRA